VTNSIRNQAGGDQVAVASDMRYCWDGQMKVFWGERYLRPTVQWHTRVRRPGIRVGDAHVPQSHQRMGIAQEEQGVFDRREKELIVAGKMVNR